MKIAVSLPRETFERAKRAVGRGRAASLSAYVTAALEQKVTFDELASVPVATSDLGDLRKLDPKVRLVAV